MRIILVSSIIAALAAGLALHVAAQPAQPTQATPRVSNEWLLDAPNDTERFRLLQRQLRGFDQPMWEVGERYRSIYQALQLENYDLALYHWDKIRVTIQNGYLKRPARRQNADAMLIDQNWAEVNRAFESRNAATAWDGFEFARSICMACHEAERVGFINNQPLFHDTARPAGR